MKHNTLDKLVKWFTDRNFTVSINNQVLLEWLDKEDETIDLEDLAEHLKMSSHES